MNLQTNFVKNGKSTILDFYFFPGPGCPGGGQNSYCKGTPWLNVSTPAPSPLHSTQSSSSHYTTHPMYTLCAYDVLFLRSAGRSGIRAGDGAFTSSTVATSTGRGRSRSVGCRIGRAERCGEPPIGHTASKS
jgi:hypothetical protein